MGYNGIKITQNCWKGNVLMMDFSKPPHGSETDTHRQRHQENEQKYLSGGKSIWYEISNWLILGGILLVIFLLFKYVF